MKYMIDTHALDLAHWRPDGRGGWESMAQSGSPAEPALWDENDPAAPRRTGFAVCFGRVAIETDGELHDAVAAEASRIVGAGVASYTAAFAVGRYGDAIDLPRASAESLAAADLHMVAARPAAVAYAVARGDLRPTRRDIRRARSMSGDVVESVCADWRRLGYDPAYETRLRERIS